MPNFKEFGMETLFKFEYRYHQYSIVGIFIPQNTYDNYIEQGEREE